MDKETTEIAGKAAKVAADSGLLAWAGGVVMAAIGWLINKVYRSLGHRINNNTQSISNLSAVVEKKADAKVVDRVLENQATLFTQQREDRELFVSRLNTISDDIHKSHVHLAERIGERPTREEVSKMIELSQGANR